MKRYTSLASLGLAAILLLSFAGCNKSDQSNSTTNKFVGTWKAEDEDATLVIKDGGVCTYTAKKRGSMENAPCKYTQKGDKITLFFGPEGSQDYGDATLESDNRMRWLKNNVESNVHFMLRQ